MFRKQPLHKADISTQIAAIKELNHILTSIGKSISENT